MKVLNFFRILIALFMTVIIKNYCISKADILPGKQDNSYVFTALMIMKSKMRHEKTG
jgi:hypothetical protein